MTHIEAAEKSPHGLALRMDGERLAMYSLANNSLALAKDREGELWQVLAPEIAEHYRDWYPAPASQWYECITVPIQMAFYWIWERFSCVL